MKNSALALLFRLYGRGVNLEQTIKDCQELTKAVIELQKENELLKNRVKVLEDGA